MPQSELVRLPGKQSLRETNIILIIEDDMYNGEFLVELILEETPFYPIHLIDSMQGLKFTQLLKPKLLICDYYLPKMNGIMFYDRLHNNIDLQKIPILMVSARMEGLEREIEKRGLVVLSKPFDLDEFFAAIEKVMGYDVRLPDRVVENAISEQLI